MSKRTEAAPGFTTRERRKGVEGFPGWRGLYRTGDPVLPPNRLYRAWNAQINDGEIICRGGQTLFSDLTTSSRQHCITSIFCTGREWRDPGEQAEIRVTGIVDMSTQTSDEPDCPLSVGLGLISNYRGDVGLFNEVGSLSNVTGRRHFFLRDGVDNTSSGTATASTTNTSIRIRDRVYVAELDGAIKYLTPGTATYTTLAAAGAQFGAGSRPFAFTYRGQLMVMGDGVMKRYNIDTAAWSTLTMPGGTTNMVPKGWTHFSVDDCIYIIGIVGNDAKVIKLATDDTITVALTCDNSGGTFQWNRALDIASNNGHLVITFVQAHSTPTVNLKVYHSTDGASWSEVTSFPSSPTNPVFKPTRMVVADGMIWSAGMDTTGSVTAQKPSYLNSYDGTDWLEILPFGTAANYSAEKVLGVSDIVQIEPANAYVADTTDL